MKMVKFVSIVLVGIIGVLLLGSAIAVADRTYGYMSRQKFEFGQALEWAWDDFQDYTKSIFWNEKKNVILEFPMANQHIQIVACTALD